MKRLLNQSEFIEIVKDTYGISKARAIHKKAYEITCDRKIAFQMCNPTYHGKHIAVPIEILAECLGITEEDFVTNFNIEYKNDN